MSVPIIKVENVLEKFSNDGFLIIDVRRADEFVGELGHIPRSRLVTLGPELDSYLDRLDTQEKIIFVCRSGARSGQATELALEKGFHDVFNMDGGMLRWNELNMEIEK